MSTNTRHEREKSGHCGILNSACLENDCLFRDFSCAFRWALNGEKSDEPPFVVQELVSHLRDWTQKAPLESLATIVERFAPSLASDVFDAYDQFLLLLNDEQKRQVLEQLSPEQAYENNVFLDARQIATKFDETLLKLLFESNDQITEAVKRYGVF